MLKKIQRFLINFISSRTFFLYVMFVVMAVLLFQRIFTLQIVQGEDKQQEFELKIKKERSIASTRGNIYDVNGIALAYNELSSSVTIEDVYESSKKNATINGILKKVLHILDENGDSISCDFNIYIDGDGEFAYSVTGSRRLRFIADVYGITQISDLEERQKNATAQDIIEYLAGSKRYAIGGLTDPNDKNSFTVGEGYTQKELLNIIAIRYTMGTTGYQKYIPVTIATDVSEETVAAIAENQDGLEGISVAEDTIRKYKDGPYYSQILGYTGKISTDELTALNSKEGMDGVKSAPDVKEYELTDIVGKAGIEKVMEEYLQGTKGYETVFVDRMGREVEVLDHVDATAGNDVYLTIDSKLQADAYNILEKFVAGILVDKIINVKNYDSTDVSSANLKIPIDNVYSALFKNNVIELSKMEAAVEGETQYSVYQTILSRRDEVLTWLSEELLSGTIAYQSLPAEYKAYESYIINNLLPENNILSGVDKTDQTYIDWTTNETISIREYLEYAISKNWIDVTQLPLDGKYSDSSEVYQQLVSYILEELDSQTFLKKLIPYMIEQNRITGTQVCILLIEQDVINPTENQIAELKSGSVSAFNFMVNLIRNLEITPAQLALDPYSASCVLTDVNTGEVRALVSYPSYDNNRLANGIDAEYYSRISSGEDLSRPMWNYATQMRTAPGSTFKMVSSTAALMEHVIDLTTRIECPGIFTRFSDYQPRCWKRSGHGSLNVSEAITNSCNVFFYEVGYQLGLNGDKYDQDLGNEKLAKYASMYGLNEKSGIEIEESEPQISDALSVVSAIGQGTNNFTTVGLARYVTTVANSGTCYDLTLLDKVTDTSGNLLVNYSANVRNTIDMPQSYWNAIHQGMRGVVQNKKYYQDFGVEVAGKTGTAEEDKSRPNHGLFVGYAPYDNPEVSMAIRIANGYSSDYACQLSKQLMTVYFDLDENGALTDSQTALSLETVVGGGD
ncbi:penicillin-binding transpeptidase domain-containing protein [Gallintestinimicrobium sp.]|uniref:penicillin-binding transpeptidase domain-containing protein n=1 Tax=Gallintestinimicrobium sp. TaxID=2981655 RepID=UPI003076FFCA